MEKKVEKPKKLLVIGAGFGRTGTMSLKKALEILLSYPCYHMIEVWKNGDQMFWSKATSGEPVDYNDVFQMYAATVDFPSCVMWKEILQQNPEAKVVLSIRSSDSWYKSFRQTISNFILSNPTMPFGIRVLYTIHPVYARAGRMLSAVLGRAGFKREFSKDACIKIFNDWNQSVMDSCPPEKLLVYEVKQGWEPLCKFLDLPIPSEPFPNVNDSAALQKNVIARSAMGWSYFAWISGATYVLIYSYLHKR